MSLEHSPDHGQFTPSFSRPKHLRKSSMLVEQNHRASRNGEKFRGPAQNNVKKLSAEQRLSLMDLLQKMPSMAPVIAMMIDHAPDSGTTIRYPKDEVVIRRNDSCDATGVKAKYCTCAACLDAYGNTDEKWEKFEDRRMVAALRETSQEDLDNALADLEIELEKMYAILQKKVREQAGTEGEPDVNAVGG